MQVNWFGDFWVPVSTLIVSLLFAFYLASVNRRQAREAFDFERDMRLAESFLRSARELSGWAVVLDHSGRKSTELNVQIAEFLGSASGQPGDRIGAYLSDRWAVVDRANRRVIDDFARWERENPQEALSLVKVLERDEQGTFSTEEDIQIQSAVRDIEGMVRDWAFPERRRACIETALRWNADRLYTRPSNIGLQVDRWMLAASPPRWFLPNWYQHVSVAVRLLLDDLKFGRLPGRLAAWRSTRRAHKHEMRAVGRFERAERQLARDRVELRKLYEGAARYHSDRGQELPPQFRMPREL